MSEFTSYKSLNKWLKERTDKEFFIACTKGNQLNVVICRDNKLIIENFLVGYWSWFTEKRANEILTFINQ